MVNLRGRNVLTLLDFTSQEIDYLLDLSRDLKRAKYTGTETPQLNGKTIALLFQKDSTRTRCAFEVAAFDQGMHTVYLGPSGTQFGKKETVEDTARVLGRMFDGIQFRGYEQEVCDKLAAHAGIPVWNGLTEKYHPTQVLADLLTIQEHKGRDLKGLKMVYLGDARYNMGNSLMIAAVKKGMNFVCAAPKSLWPAQELINECKKIAADTGGSLTFTENPNESTKNADVITTDVWVSMGEPESVWKERIDLLKAFQVNKSLMNNAKPDAIFLHCLPSFHNADTTVGKRIQEKYGISEMEVSDEVFESKQSVVFQQAENRLHTIKAMMLATIGG